MSRTWKIRFADGTVVRGSSDTAYIGQGNQCEIRLGNDGEYEDATFAVMVRNADSQTWRLVRIDDDADIRINGDQLHLVHYLNEKDIVCIAETGDEFRFFTETEKNDTDASHIIRRSIQASVATACIILLALGAVFYIKNLNTISEEHIEGLKGSICKVRVDEVLLQQVDTAYGQYKVTTLASVRLESSSCSGTGFFCSDGRFVTARHCVEPWITLPMTGKESLTEEGQMAEIARWACACEIFNHTRDSVANGYRRVISLCTIMKEHKNVLHTFSTDTCMFRIEDDIIRNLGGPKDRILWRETGNVKLKSALGDITCVQTGITGAIEPAPQSIFCRMNGRTPVVHWGFRADRDEAEFKSGEITFDVTETGRCIEHKSSEGMQQGFSGGPVLIRHRGNVYAAGVISKVGEDGKETYFSIPITEIDNAKRRW